MLMDIFRAAASTSATGANQGSSAAVGTVTSYAAHTSPNVSGPLCSLASMLSSTCRYQSDKEVPPMNLSFMNVSMNGRVVASNSSRRIRALPFSSWYDQAPSIECTCTSDTAPGFAATAVATDTDNALR